MLVSGPVVEICHLRHSKMVSKLFILLKVAVTLILFTSPLSLMNASAPSLS